MKTKMIASIDISALLDAIGPDAIPSERDINAAVRKRLTNAQISLRDLGEGEPIQKDDALTVSVTGPTPRFNKARVTWMMIQRTNETFHPQSPETADGAASRCPDQM